MREDEITRTAVPDHSGGKSLQDSISIEKIWTWQYAPVIPVMVGSIK
jgi:hypothetical protein